MKVKQTPADFVVEEVLPLKILESGAFTIYRIEKTDMETTVALGHMANRLGIAQSDIGYAGIKDKHARTVQYASVPSTLKQISMSEPRLRISLIGYSDAAIRFGMHTANKFTITVRQLLRGRVENLRKRTEIAFSNPIPNYYDSQRFGSFINGESIGLFVQRGEFFEALRVYLTAERKSDLAHIKANKREIAKVWPKLAEAAALVTDRVFADIVAAYVKTNDWKAAYERIPAFEREMQEQAVASFIWNESLKTLLKEVKTERTFSVEYAAGSLLFGLPESPLPQNLGERKDIVAAVAKLHDIIVPERFDWERPLLFSVQDGKIDNITSDDLAKRPDQMQKVTFIFKLQPGSYATIVLKAILRC